MMHLENVVTASLIAGLAASHADARVSCVAGKIRDVATYVRQAHCREAIGRAEVRYVIETRDGLVRYRLCLDDAAVTDMRVGDAVEHCSSWRKLR